MNIVFNLLLILHIIAGSVALTSAFGALFCKKGQTHHRQWGRRFFYAMTVIFITAIPLSIIKKIWFLFLIALFSYYLAFSGWRFATNKAGPQKLDIIINRSMIAVSLLMISFGLVIYKTEVYQPIVLMVFGFIGLNFSIADYRFYKNKQNKDKLRIAHHLGAMLGATIAATTAFSVVNIHIQPEIIVWLAPTVIFTPLIIYWKWRVLSAPK